MVLLITKYDKIDKNQKLIDEIKIFIEDQQKSFWKFPYFFISAQDSIEGNNKKKNQKSKVTQFLQSAIKLYDLASKIITTSQLNKILEQVLRFYLLISASAS